MINSDLKRKIKMLDCDNKAFKDSKDILKDYVFSMRACSFLELNDIERKILLLYTSDNFSKKEVIGFLNHIPFINSNSSDIDELFFYAKLLKDSYINCDGLMVSKRNQQQIKKLYKYFNNKPEILMSSIMQNFSFLRNILIGKKVLIISDGKEYIKGINKKSFSYISVNYEDVNQFSSWVEWIDYLKMRIMTQDFDIAFVHVPFLSNIICNFINVTLMKVAIVKGD